MRVGLIGTGGFGRFVLQGYALTPDVTVVAVADTLAERAKAVAGEFGVARSFDRYEDLVGCDEVDLVHIVTPPPVHHEMAIAALTAGRPVLCEKPLAMDSAEAAAMRDAAIAAGVVHAVDHEMRYDPLHRHARRLLAEGYVGEIRLASLQLVVNYGCNPLYPTNYAHWTVQRSAGGGTLAQHVIHFLDLARFLFGDVTVLGGTMATAQPVRPVLGPEVQPGDPLGPDVPTAGEGPCDGDDTVALHGTLPGGGVLAVASTWSALHPSGAAWEIYGSEGTLRLSTAHGLTGARHDETELAPLAAPAELAPPGMDALAPDLLRRSGVVDGPALLGLFAGLAQDVAAAVEGRDSARIFPTFDDGLANQENIDVLSRASEAR
ncbi:MAG TPA: Gfo/Idh/MocA family oxidoreductase [Acidimicrobiia bacterium]|nr:Gfo/Idh/MocA family oxidoreductase [Acidimicrobiia bacterium]